MGFLIGSFYNPKLSFLLVLLIVPFSWGKYGGGTGEPNNPYLISDANHLCEIGQEESDWNKHFEMTADIDFSNCSSQFSAIGYVRTRGQQKPFTGVFDGNSHTISSFIYAPSNEFAVALFGYVSGSDSKIKNIGLIAPNITGFSADLCTGALVGRLEDGNVSGCWVKGQYLTGKDRVGGLIGFCEGGIISNSYSNIEVSGDDSVGGLIGQNESGTIINCYSSGYISGISEIGGLTGSDTAGDYTSCFWDITVNPLITGIGNISDPPEVIGQTTELMQRASTYINEGWDFINIWDICEGTNYPKMIWQKPITGDFLCPDGVDMIDFSILAGQWQFITLKADFAPDGGDNIVNFLDLAVFSNSWNSAVNLPNWNPLCDVAPDGGDEKIDELDLAVFIEQWLKYGSLQLETDIAPLDGDDVVNTFDLAEVLSNWLREF